MKLLPNAGKPAAVAIRCSGILAYFYLVCPDDALRGRLLTNDLAEITRNHVSLCQPDGACDTVAADGTAILEENGDLLDVKHLDEAMRE